MFCDTQTVTHGNHLNIISQRENVLDMCSIYNNNNNRYLYSALPCVTQCAVTQNECKFKKMVVI